MRVHTFFIVLGMIVLIVAGYYFIGVGATMILLSLFMFTQATLFCFKKGYYEKLLKFMNPVSYNNYKEKGEDFFRKLVKTNYICLYIISIITFFNGIFFFNINKKIQLNFDISYFIAIGVIALVISILAYVIDRIVSKKAKNIRAFILWGSITGILIFFIIFVIFAFILNNKYYIGNQEGFISKTKLSNNSFLTYRGKDISYLPLPSNMKMYKMFEDAYKEKEHGAIPIEKIKGRILLAASKMDESWLASYSVGLMESRLIKSKFDRPYKTILFEKCSHLIGITPDAKKHRLIPLLLLAFKQERKCPKECNAARKQAEVEISKWLFEW